MRYLPALLILALSTAACDQARTESLKTLIEGTERESLGNTEEAYVYYRRAYGLDNANHRALFQMALIELYDQDEPERALEHLKQAAALEDGDRDVFYQLGRFYATADPIAAEDALSNLDRAIAIDPNYGEAHYYKGVVYVSQEKFAEADRAFREAITLRPDYSPAWQDLGDLYESLDQEEAAEAVYRRALDYADDLGPIYNSLGMLKMQADAPKDAAVLFERAMGASPERTDVLFNIASAYIASNDTRNAFRYLGEYLNRSRGDESQAATLEVAQILRNAMLEELERAPAAP